MFYVTTTIDGTQHTQTASDTSLPAVLGMAATGLTQDGYRFVSQRWSETKATSHAFYVRESDDAVATIVISHDR